MTERHGAIGVLERAGRYLLVQRAEGLSHAGAWCFPGGHVEPGETSREAVIRELAEELSLIVEPVEMLGIVRIATPAYRLDTWRVREAGGVLLARESEVAAVAFMTIEEIRSVSRAMPSNAEVLALLGGMIG